MLSNELHTSIFEAALLEVFADSFSLANVASMKLEESVLFL
ncbi:hypothetical protein FM115_07520 [Marinilactibacillus psychrotolerans 42ea]|uniref:Uncharacterized protein n=1 Tax=Marinilactibacillus psychrotolerans 42ea TaxID=1255609 RepID=A0A1R4JZT4_9LACT|nr:hypothetical protein FM115_07520 [Marinilactibacillus psychrotolerans 42ea]